MVQLPGHCESFTLSSSAFIERASGYASFLPDLITGDLDSMRDGVKEYYVSRVGSRLLLPKLY